ncbi:MAG: extradiol ring-cleavage dioxygenase, partial [Candidatus Binataceae bacterium]
LDGVVLGSLRSGDSVPLRTLPLELLLSGSSEIRNWIMTAGAFDGVKTAWSEYVPVYRTPAGTGIGLAFARWE